MATNTEKRNGGDWVILRTAGPRTLPLAQSLQKAGIAAWTPKRSQERRRGRARVRYNVDVPIMPTFVFAPATDVMQLRGILASPTHPHPAFSLFHYVNSIPLIRDSELATIHAMEERYRKAERKGQRHSFTKGESVKTEEPAFLGLSGIVEKFDGRFAIVHFGGGLRVKVGGWLLISDQVRAA